MLPDPAVAPVALCLLRYEHHSKLSGMLMPQQQPGEGKKDGRGLRNTFGPLSPSSSAFSAFSFATCSRYAFCSSFSTACATSLSAHGCRTCGAVMMFSHSAESDQI